MKIGIIGPNEFEHLMEVMKLSRPELEIKLDELAVILAQSGKEVVLTPDKNSVLAYLGRSYLENKGKKIFEIVPLEEKDCEDYLDLSLGEVISCKIWPLQPSKFNEECDIMVCIGYGGMVLAEMGFSKYYNPKKIYILKEFVSKHLPKEIEKSLDLSYIPLIKLGRILK